MARDFGEVCEDAVCEVEGDEGQMPPPRTRTVIVSAASSASGASFFHSIADALNTYTVTTSADDIGTIAAGVIPDSAIFSAGSHGI